MRLRVFIVATVAFLLTYALLASVAPERQMTALGANSTTGASALTSSSCHSRGGKRCPTTTTTTTSSASTTTTTAISTTTTSTTSSSSSPTTTTTSTTTTAGCVGNPLTSQSQVQPNTSYCGGVVVGAITLANGDTWTGGGVSGAVTGQDQAAVQCGSPCTLVNMNVHNNPGAWYGIAAPQGSFAGPMTVTGGRVTGTGTLGVAGSDIGGLTISGVEIDHNGASASCGNEGGGFKGINSGARLTNNYVHDNSCTGIWFDINAGINGANEIDHNTVASNADGGIFYEISQNALIHDNTVTGNGAGACGWLWGAGIGIASSFNVQVYNNTVANNCNGIGETQQTRTDSTPPAHLLQNNSVHNNTVSNSGLTGIAEDNGDNGVFTRNNTFQANGYHESSCSASDWAWNNGAHAFSTWQSLGLDTSGPCGP